MKVDRYEIEAELGQGAMGNVFLATDPVLSRQVAIKMLPFFQANDPSYQELFDREAQLVASLEHDCITPIFDYGIHGNQLFIVMQYMRGGTLTDLIETKPMKPNQLLPVVERVAQGLAFAHENRVIHRDVKPSNILFDASGNASLADFGLAKPLDIRTGFSGVKMIGTPAYMSPEQINGEPLDGRSDIYALGITIYCALTGQLPYENESVMGMAAAHLTEPIPDIRQVRPRLAQGWQEILNKAMAKKREARYATVGELAKDVADLVNGRWHLRKLF